MRLLKHNLLATLYFNFKMLPWKQAIRIPFILYGKVKFIRTSGSISLKDSCNIGSIRIGGQGSEMFPNETTVIDIAGTLKIKGDTITIGAGSVLRIEKKGNVILHHNNIIGAKNIILSEELIDVGENFVSSWNCQIMDTDTHSIQDINTQNIKQRYAPVKIGDRCWIGNHVLINKGTILPEDTIVSASSLCNKDYSNIGTYCIIGGIPAKLLAIGKKRLKDKL